LRRVRGWMLEAEVPDAAPERSLEDRGAAAGEMLLAHVVAASVLSARTQRA